VVCFRDIIVNTVHTGDNRDDDDDDDDNNNNNMCYDRQFPETEMCSRQKVRKFENIKCLQ